MAWMATEPACANEACNVTNTDLFRWHALWPRLADAFGMPLGSVRPLRLAEAMAGRDELWRQVCARHGLAQPRLDRVANWGYADATLERTWDEILSHNKARPPRVPRLGRQPGALLRRARRVPAGRDPAGLSARRTPRQPPRTPGGHRPAPAAHRHADRTAKASDPRCRRTPAHGRGAVPARYGRARPSAAVRRPASGRGLSSSTPLTS